MKTPIRFKSFDSGIRWVGLIAAITQLCTLNPQPAAAQTNCTPTPSGLVAWWPGDGFAFDVAGINHGTLYGGVTYGPGEVGQGFSFDGLTGYADTTPSDLSWISNTFTIEFWAWPNASRSATSESASGTVGTSGQRYAIFPQYGGSSGPAGVGVSVGNNGVSIFEHAASYLPSLLVYNSSVTNWTHIAVVYNNEQPSLYVNGTLVRTGLTSTRSYVFPSKTFSDSGTYGKYSGLLDEVSIYTRVLSSNEVAAIYAAGGAGKCYTNFSAPIFVVQPVSQTNFVLSSVTLAGGAMGTPRPQYQWLTNGVPLLGATNPVLALNNLTTNQSAAYKLVASNIFGSATSAVATVNISIPPFLSGIGSFETGWEGWTTDDAAIWAVGVPTAGPGAAHSGTNCAATGLTGNVPAYESTRLVSPVFVVPVANQNPRLRWWQWFLFGSGNSTGPDGGDFQISTNNGASWQTLAHYGASGSVAYDSGGWTRPSVDLSAYAGQSVQIAFHFYSEANSVAVGPGWFIDEVTLVTGPITTLTANVPVDFENGLGDWSVDNGAWQVGVPTAAHSGTNCAATGLTGNVPAYESTRLVSPVFVVPVANQNPRLRWWQWFLFGSGNSTGPDGGDFQISTNNGTSWQTLAHYGSSGSVAYYSGGWTRPSIDLSAYAGQSVQIAFHFYSEANSVAVGPGWFVDEVTLVTGPITALTANVPVDFEDGLGDWSVDNGAWQVGVPVAGPGAAHSGTNCAATGLTGNVPAYQSSRLVSPVFVVPVANQNPRLRWWQWFLFGSGSSTGPDGGDFQISTNSGTSWQTLAHYGASGSVAYYSGGWTRPSVDLSAYAGQSVQIAFHFYSQANSVAVGPGWFIDEVTLKSGPDIFNNPETFEFSWGDWDTDNYGLWQIGVPTVGPPLTNSSRAHSPVSVAATLLNESYSANSSGRLITPRFIVPSVSGDDRVILRFWQWYQYGTGDAGLVQISTPYDTNWNTLDVAATNGTSGAWTLATVDLTQFQGQEVRVAFYHTANGDGSVGAGWFIDDVSLSSFVPTPLTLDQISTNRFTANGQYQFFVLHVPPGGHFRLTLADLDGLGANELYLRRGSLPTPGAYDYRFQLNGAPNQTVFAPDAGAGDWYVLAYNAAGPIPGDYTLNAQFFTGVVLDSLTPASLGNSVPGTVTINGAGFTPDTTVALVKGGSVFPQGRRI